MTDEKDAVREEWAVDLGFGPCAARDERYARGWVQSYADHPDALDPGDPWPILLRRTVTTTAWEPVQSPGGSGS